MHSAEVHAWQLAPQPARYPRRLALLCTRRVCPDLRRLPRQARLAAIRCQSAHERPEQGGAHGPNFVECQLQAEHLSYVYGSS